MEELKTEITMTNFQFGSLCHSGIPNIYDNPHLELTDAGKELVIDDMRYELELRAKNKRPSWEINLRNSQKTMELLSLLCFSGGRSNSHIYR